MPARRRMLTRYCTRPRRSCSPAYEDFCFSSRTRRTRIDRSINQIGSVCLSLGVVRVWRVGGGRARGKRHRGTAEGKRVHGRGEVVKVRRGGGEPSSSSSRFSVRFQSPTRGASVKFAVATFPGTESGREKNHEPALGRLFMEGGLVMRVILPPGDEGVVAQHAETLTPTGLADDRATTDPAPSDRFFCWR